MFDLIKKITAQRHNDVALLFKNDGINLPVTPVNVYDCYEALGNDFKNDVHSLLTANATGTEQPKKAGLFSNIKNFFSKNTQPLTDSASVIDASDKTHVLLFIGVVTIFILIGLVIITRKKQ